MTTYPLFSAAALTIAVFQTRKNAMAISSENRKTGIFTGDGKTTRYPFDFRILKTEHIAVITDDAIGNEHILSEGRDYTAALETDGGHIDLAAPLAQGRRLVIVSNQPYLQPAVFTNHGGFYPANLNDALDKLVIQDQQIREQVGRALKVSVISGIDLTLPAPSPGKGIGWNADGSALINTDHLQRAQSAADTAVQRAEQIQNILRNTKDIPKTVSSVAKLRQEENEGRPAFVASYYENGTTGGGTFIPDPADKTTPDDGVTVIVGKDGTRWKRSDGKLTLADAGAQNTEADKGDALARILAAGRIALIDRQETISLSLSGAKQFMQATGRVEFAANTTINLPAGTIDFDKRLLLDNPTLGKLTIKGSPAVKIKAAGARAAGGANRTCLIEYDMPANHGIAAGDYIIATEAAGTGTYKAAEGCYKVQTASAEKITVLCPFFDTPPDFTVSGISLYHIRTVLRWTGESVGMAVVSSLEELRDVVLLGSYDSTNGIPSDSPADGLQIGSAVNTPETGITAGQRLTTGSFYGCRLGIIGWHGNGIQVLGGSATFVIAAACGNGWRGFQSGDGATLSAKGAAAHGNGSSGFEAEAGGFLDAANSSAVGNREQGYYAIGTASISAIRAVAAGNGASGFEAKKNGNIIADKAVAQHNNIGVSAVSGTVFAGSGATVTDNKTADIRTSAGGEADLSGAAAVGKINQDNMSGSLIRNRDGRVVHAKTVALHQDESHSFSSNFSSSGELNLFLNGSHLLRLKPDGTFSAASDATQPLGSLSSRWAQIYSSTAAISTSDAREKQDIGDIPDTVIDAWRKVKIKQYRWIAAVAEKGTGARFHSGLIAQTIKDTFEEAGLDAQHYGLLCLDQWPEAPAVPAVTDENGNILIPGTPYRPAGSRWGIRAEECLFLEAESNRRLIENLKRRIEALESEKNA